ncbi:SBBP repeat-containing protein [Arthrobacter sp. ISL-5]|uniref:SBBP repeat-containing protein n=1 Tax=Arthrobacter sp. ISL-5 TaxID=2819111 RepID=UPI001BE6BDBB|nr:SBBP repeat-containing protein [Arthrobacter sp. ISL-5]MBT2551841.1 SBBP repeat-containing protein [Arthrobacter sp. ISL-5]
MTGQTTSTDFPTTPGAFDTTFNGGFDDAFVTKLSPTGSSLLYSTYLGGSGTSQGNGIAVDAAGSAYVTGQTGAGGFPTTPGAFDTTLDFIDAFVTKLSPTGSSLLYSTYLGGSGPDLGFGVAVDASGSAYVTGRAGSTNFPTTAGAFDTTLDGAADAFVTTLSPTGSALVDSTYLGGSDIENGRGIAVDASGSAYVTGATGSAGFPTTAGAFDTTFNGGFDAFTAPRPPSRSRPRPTPTTSPPSTA